MRRRLIPLFAAVLLCLGGVCNALTLANIRTAVRRNVRDTATSTTLQRYSDSLLNDLINEAQRDVVMNTWVIQKTTSVNTSGDVTLALPADVIQIYRVTIAGANLSEITLQQRDADLDNNAWAGNVSTPTYYIQDRVRTGGTASNQLMTLTIVPAPAVITAVSVYYYALATDLSSDSDVPFNGINWFNAYDDLLTWYVTYRLLYIENMADKAKLFKDQYDTRLGVLFEDYGVKPQRNPAVPIKEQKP